MEQNASDTRSKKAIEMQVSGLLINQQVKKFFTTNNYGKLFGFFYYKKFKNKLNQRFWVLIKF